ncbi:unnamed protein product [Bathycoccus prasinos]
MYTQTRVRERTRGQIEGARSERVSLFVEELRCTKRTHKKRKRKEEVAPWIVNSSHRGQHRNKNRYTQKV